MQADNNPPNNEGGEQEEQQEQQQDAASEGVQGDSKKDEDAKRDEEFVKEAIASVLFAQLDQIEGD